MIEDIFFNENDYCDYQIGLTGIFSLLVGYAIGLPPMYNTETGDAGVGVFGLMDYGSNNGRGVIPSPPNAWSKIYMGWEDPIVIENQSYNEQYDFSINNSPQGLKTSIFFLFLAAIKGKLISFRSSPGIKFNGFTFNHSIEQFNSSSKSQAAPISHIF